MIIDKNSDSSVDLVDWLRRSTDESNNLARNNMLDSARIDDVYKLTGEKKVLDILYDEETGRLTIVYKDGSTVSIYLDPNGGGCDCDLSEYAKLTDLEAEVTELESKIPTSTSKLTNDSDFVNSTQVDDRIKEVVGAAPEALDTLHEISKALGDDPDFASTITNQIADVKKSIPSIEGLASETFVKDQINAIPKTDLTGYAKEEWVKSQGYLTEHQDISHLASKDYVNEQISKIEHPVVDLTEYAKTSEVSEAIVKSETNTKAWVGEQKYLTEHQDISHLATKEEIPSLEGYATETWVVDKLAELEAGEDVDHSVLATKDELKAVEAKIPSIEGLATETYVNEKIDAIEHPTVDLSAYATKDELNSKIATLNSNFQWKDTVVTYEDIAKVYPNPQEGFSVYVDDERTTYVYMGGEWVAAASADDSEPIATEELDGLMPAEAMRKLNSLENYDDSSIKGDMTTLEAKLSFIEAKIAELSRTNIEVVAPSTSGTSLNDASKDYAIQGNITAKMTVANSKSVTISDSVISNDARASIKSTGDVELKNVSTEGTFAKANGNTVLNITEARSVTIKDMTVSSTQYNGMEIGLIGSVLPKSVIIDNCNFGGETSNNVISIHGTADEAIINISNCKFSKSSNPLRLSNRTGAKVTVNITNCSCEEWDARPEWAGFIICQDYTSKSIEKAKQANLFGSDKVTINFINFTLPGGKKLTKPEDMSEICGSGNNQILYVYRDAEYAADKANYKFTSYGDAYPQINII